MNQLEVRAQIGPGIPGLEFDGFHGTFPHCCGRIMLALQIRLMSWPRPVWRKWTRAAADSAVTPSRRDRNGGLLTFREFAPLQHSDNSVKRPTGRAERTPFVFKVTRGRVRTGTEAIHSTDSSHPPCPPHPHTPALSPLQT